MCSPEANDPRVRDSGESAAGGASEGVVVPIEPCLAAGEPVNEVGMGQHYRKSKHM